MTNRIYLYSCTCLYIPLLFVCFSGSLLGQDSSHRVETKTTETAYITSIWVGMNAFVDKPQWTGDGKSFYLLEKTGAIYQLQYPTFEVIKSNKLELESPTLGIAQRWLLLVDQFNSEVVLVNPKSLDERGRIPVPSLKLAYGVPGSDLVYVLAGDRSSLHTLNLKTRKLVEFKDPKVGPITGASLKVTPDGKHVFVAGRVIQHLRVTGERLKYITRTPDIASNPGGVYVSPDSNYVALPSGGGNDGVAGLPRRGYATYLFNTSDLSQGVRRLETGAYPRSIGWDAKSKWVYAQDFEHQLKIYSNKTGAMHSEYALAKRGADSVRYSSHPEGGGRVLVTIVGGGPTESGPARLFNVEIR